MKKIGITTFQNAYNYGAVLQAFALQSYLKSCGYNVKIIDYDNYAIKKNYQYKLKFTGNIKKDLREVGKNLLYRNKKKTRFNGFERFIQENLDMTESMSYDILKKLDNIEFDTLITGSDQVWNPDITEGLDDIYTLNFGSKDTKRISYAASMGKSKINEENKNLYKEKLENIDYISVREENCEEELSKIFKNKDITTVLDPVFLLSREEWINKIKNVKNEKEKYILTYAVNRDSEHQKIVDYLSEKTGFKVIYFENRNRYKNVLRSAYKDDPISFINLIKNAEYVVTTSFHATAFSVIFQKKFFSIPHRETGSRVTNLLTKMGLNNRIFYSFEEFKNSDYTKEIDWNIVNMNMKTNIEKSKEWLNKALEG